MSADLFRRRRALKAAWKYVPCPAVKSRRVLSKNSLQYAFVQTSMKPQIKGILIAAALGLWASTASANYIAGNVRCIDTFTPLGGVSVTAQGTLHTYQTVTLADGTFSIPVDTVIDTYI